MTGSTFFGGVRACCDAERTIAICNTGDCDLHVTDVAFRHDNPHWTLVNNPFPATLKPGSYLGVVIRYHAAEKFPRSCDLVITSDDPVTPVTMVEIIASTIWDECDSNGAEGQCGGGGRQRCDCRRPCGHDRDCERGCDRSVPARADCR